MSAYYRSALFRSAVRHKHCMTVMSVLYRSAITYCNSNVVIKVGSRQVGSVKKLHDRHITNLQIGGRQVGNSVHRTCRQVHRQPAYLIFSICQLPTIYLPSYTLVSAYCLPVCRRPVSLSSPHYAIFVYRRHVYRLSSYSFVSAN